MMITEDQVERIENILNSAAAALVDMKKSLRDDVDDATQTFIEAAGEVNERVNVALGVYVNSLMRKKVK